jgi:peptidyl-prolyl cis-trans isomerase B (cyclophilin B)
MKKFVCLSLLLVNVGLVNLFAQADKKDEKKAEAKPAAANVKEVAVIKTTMGEMVAEFWPEVAPNTVENFKKLARKGFYDGTASHRIIKGFMVQLGDPFTKDASREADWGKGDPGYKIKAEFNDRKHVRGVLSMARGGDPDSAGCQFFICLAPATGLDNQYTTFGKLIKGDDVLEKLGNVPVKPNPFDPRREMSRPIERVGVESIKIVPADSIK